MMQTQLIKIVEDQEGWVDWGKRKIQENPGTSFALCVCAAPFAIAEAIPAAAGSLAILGAGALTDWWLGPTRIDELPASKAVSLRDRDDNQLEVNRTYARHPLRRVYPNTLVAADRFHSHMISEQMADIENFFKAHVLLKHLRITVSSATGAKLDGSVTKVGEEMGIKAHLNSAIHHELEHIEHNPVIVPYMSEPYWISEFPEVRAAIASSSNGKFLRTIGMDTSFGLTASMALKAGINVDWLSKQLFRIEASYGELNSPSSE